VPKTPAVQPPNKTKAPKASAKHTPAPQAASPDKGQAAGLVQRAIDDPALLSAADVVSLQQQVGNSAVQGILARRSVTPNPAATSPAAPAAHIVQREILLTDEEDMRDEPQSATLAGSTAAAGNPTDGETNSSSGMPAANSAPPASITEDDDTVSRKSEAGLPRAIQREASATDDEETLTETDAASASGMAAAQTPPPSSNPDDDETISRKAEDGPVVGAAGGPVDGDLEQNVQRERGSGQGLPQAVRGKMEKAFDANFSGVKLHTDSQSDSLNRSFGARAFTTGQDVFFKSGEFNPASTDGQSLLAHELTHVVQQSGGAVRRKARAGARRSYRPPTLSRAAADIAQRDVTGYMGEQRDKWKGKSLAYQAAMVPFGGLYGAGKGAMQGYQGIHQALGGRGWGARIGAGILGTLALPFTMAWGALRGTASGIANPLISAGQAIGSGARSAGQAIGTEVRQARGQYQPIPIDQRNAAVGPHATPELPEEAQSRLTSLMSRRVPGSGLAPPGALPPEQRAAALAQQRNIGLNREDNLIANSNASLTNTALTGISSTAASGRALTGWTSGASEANFSSNLTGASSAFGALGATAGIVGAGASLLEAQQGARQATDSSFGGTQRGLGGLQAVSSTSDAVRQSATASFNIASLTGSGAAAAAAGLVAGGAGVVMGVIDMIRGGIQINSARDAEKALHAITFLVERDTSNAYTPAQKALILRAATTAAAAQRMRFLGGATNVARGGVTIAGGALLLISATNPVGWALLGVAAIVGAIYAFYKLYQKRKRKRQVAARELGIEAWRNRWKAKKKEKKREIEGQVAWYHPLERSQRLEAAIGKDPLEITLKQQGYENPGHFYSQYIKMTAESLHANAVMGSKINRSRPAPEDRARLQMLELLETIGLKVNQDKDPRTPSAKRIAEALDN
jgi:hypothetical protein